ncbi:MAG: tetraacyldisaccharide 4'-kinase [Elusimicrobia bacterium]|nr:tetraacyldisaccharide 4'-kinase [Elusimicrobiota bacterium]
MNKKLQKHFLSLATGEKEAPVVVAVMLAALSWLYVSIIKIKQYIYEKLKKKKHLFAAVISVGNITVGGTGKTPFVIMLAKYLKNRKKKVAILSRGYKRKKSIGRGEGIEKGISVVSTGKEVLLTPEEAGDEPYLMAKYLTNVPIMVGSDRVKSGQYAIDSFSSEVLILDDGFSYYPLYRNIDVVLVDATCPFGNHHCLPRGIMREPMSGLKRADVIVLTKTNLVSPEEADLIINNIKKYNSYAAILKGVHKPLDLINLATGETLAVSFLRHKEIAALSSIAAPESFEKTLAEIGAKVVKTIRYPDHHYYTKDDFIQILEQAEYNFIVTTEKDTTRFKKEFWNLEKIARVNFFSLRLEMEIIKGEAEWLKKLKQLIL